MYVYIIATKRCKQNTYIVKNFLKNWTTERLENLATRNEKYAVDPNTPIDTRNAYAIAAKQMRDELETRNK